ncbi:hypothetical protein [Actinomadura xylanilytica]|nr:hypothetical protein [Actinomadura xylanilytica]MDL4770682.1 hypothetical protein [Actinomadura xylanilytica]
MSGLRGGHDDQSCYGGGRARDGYWGFAVLVEARADDDRAGPAYEALA